MTKGTIAIIDSDGKIYASEEFDGDMSPTNLGKEIINLLKYVYNIDAFIEAVNYFNNNHLFCFNPSIEEVSGDWYNTCYDYHGKWNSDYIYIKNLSEDTRYFVTPDGFVALPPNDVLTLHFGKLLEENEDRVIDVNVGDIVTVADIEWIVLNKTENSVFCLTKNLIDTKIFDDKTPDYAESKIRTYLHNFAQTIKNKVGEDALISREIDLTTNEGKTYYGIITDDIGLLTESEYKEFEPIIKKYPVNNSWWLATTDSSLIFAVRRVRSDGTSGFSRCYRNSGVRPICIFPSEIF